MKYLKVNKQLNIMEKQINKVTVGNLDCVTYSINGYKHSQVGIIEKFTKECISFRIYDGDDRLPLTYEQILEIGEPEKI